VVAGGLHVDPVGVENEPAVVVAVVLDHDARFGDGLCLRRRARVIEGARTAARVDGGTVVDGEGDVHALAYRLH